MSMEADLSFISFLKSLPLSFWVDVAGVSGFILSLFLAVLKLCSERLKIKTGTFTLIETDRAPNSLFLFGVIENRTSIPFSLVDISVSLGKKYRIPVEHTVRTYQHHATHDKAEVKPVVLSRAFPVRFDSYAAEPFLLEVSRQHIDMRFLLPPDDSAHNRKEQSRKQSPQTRMRGILQPRPSLVMSTSRGHRVVPLRVSSCKGWDWLELYAVRKAGHEEKIVFSE